MTAWTPIAIVSAIEVGVTLGPTFRAFSAQDRIDRERDDDIRTAIAGYEAGLVIPALADLVSEINDVRREDEPISEALARAEAARKLGPAVDASIRSQSPRARQRTLVHRHLACGACLVTAQVAGPVALYSTVTDGYNLPHNLVIVATVIFAIAALGALLVGILVVLGQNALMRAIRDGRDAA
jgi:hypothetical protein